MDFKENNYQVKSGGLSKRSLVSNFWREIIYFVSILNFYGFSRFPKNEMDQSSTVEARVLSQ